MAKPFSIDFLIDMIDSGITETFENVQGIYLDRGTSLFETLATITAEQASLPVGDRCATLAAQVAHVNFYMTYLLGFARGEEQEKADWGYIWNTVSSVNYEEWAASQNRLLATFGELRAVLKDRDVMETEEGIESVMAILIHTAYHLGEIRQALCTLTI